MRSLSVRETLRRMIMLSSTVALLLACAAFVAVDLVGSHRTLRSDLGILAEVIASNGAASVMFGDRESADAVLAALSARPSIEAACIYGKDGRLFAPYVARRSGHHPPPTSPAVGTRWTFDHVEVTRLMVLDDEPVGTLYLLSDVRELTARIRRYLVAASIILLLSLLIAWAISRPLQKKLADPILTLARVAGRVRTDKDYSVRAGARHTTVSEIEMLTSAFDEMLAGIQARDRELEAQRANLELQVADRTAQLQTANLHLIEARDEAQRVADLNQYLARHKHAILNTAAEGIFGLDDHGVATFINPAAASLLGSTVAGLIGRPLHTIIHDADLAELPLERCPVCSPARDLATRSGTVKLVACDGRVVPIEYTTRSMGGDDHQGGAVVTFRDITERLAVEQMKDEFVSTVSHELRTPLTSIRGALGLLGSGLLGDVDKRANRMLDIAVTNTDRLVRLINDILDLERISSGKVELHHAHVGAADLIRDAVDVVQNVADRADVTIVIERADAILLADRDRLVQTLTNLLGNAVKFSGPGKVVRVGGTRSGDEFTFYVSDEGRGIPREKLEMVFERFKQVNASDSRDKGGTGLGLAISRSIVEAHGGRIWVESRELEGSTFRFSLPLPARQKGCSVAPKTRYVVICGESASRGELAGAIAANGFESIVVSSVREVVDHPEASAVIVDVTEDRSVIEQVRRCPSPPAAAKLPPVIIACDPAEFFDTTAATVASFLRAPFTPANVAAALAAANGVLPVLIVEDDVDLAKVIATSLENQGLETLWAATGKEAIAAAATVTPSLVVLDLALPEIDGFGVAEWMREQQRLSMVPLLVYSASEVPHAEQERLRLGETEFLTKSRAPLTTLTARVFALLSGEPTMEETAGAA